MQAAGDDSGGGALPMVIGGMTAVLVLGVVGKLFGGKRQKTCVKGGIDSSIYESEGEAL